MQFRVVFPIVAAVALITLRREAVAAMRRLLLRREIRQGQRLLRELQEHACRCAAAEGRAARAALKASLAASVSARALVDDRLLKLVDHPPRQRSAGVGTLWALQLLAARIKADSAACLGAAVEPARKPPSRSEMIQAEHAALHSLGAGPGPKALAAALRALRQLESSLDFQAALLCEQMRVHEESSYSRDNFACASTLPPILSCAGCEPFPVSFPHARARESTHAHHEICGAVVFGLAMAVRSGDGGYSGGYGGTLWRVHQLVRRLLVPLVLVVFGSSSVVSKSPGA